MTVIRRTPVFDSGSKVLLVTLHRQGRWVWDSWETHLRNGSWQAPPFVGYCRLSLFFLRELSPISYGRLSLPLNLCRKYHQLFWSTTPAFKQLCSFFLWIKDPHVHCEGTFCCWCWYADFCWLPPDVRAAQRGARIVACWKRLEDACWCGRYTYVEVCRRFWDSVSKAI